MTDTWWQVALDIAQIVAGAAAAYALIQVEVFRRQERVAKERDFAEQVTAWAVTEGEADSDLSEEFVGGVVIRNGTPNTISVKIKTGRRNPSDLEKFDDDGFKGQSFNVIPHGVYYSQHYTNKEGKPVWSAPKPVGTASGKFVIDWRSVDPKKGPVEVTLAPVSVMPEPKAVTQFEFELGGKRWERRNGSGLRLVKPKNVTSEPERILQSEFKASEQLELVQPKQRQDHSVNARVQAVFTDVAHYLTGRSLPTEDLVGVRVEVVEQFRDLFTNVQLSRRRQSVSLGLPGLGTTIYLAGDGKGEIPTGSEHSGRVTRACTLNTVKFRASLKPASKSGVELVDAFMAALRDLGEHAGVCSCGTPYTFSTD